MKPNTANELKKHLSQMKAGVAFIGYLPLFECHF